jgi:hypothetical protein
MARVDFFFSVAAFIRYNLSMPEAIFPSIMMLFCTQIAYVVQERDAGEALTNLYGTKFES